MGFFPILILKGRVVLASVYLTPPTLVFKFRAKTLIIDMHVEHIRENTTQDTKSTILV